MSSMSLGAGVEKPEVCTAVAGHVATIGVWVGRWDALRGVGSLYHL